MNIIKLSQVQKICLSGILLALIIVFTKVLSVQNLPALPFVRISIGPALIIFTSLILGPVYGGIVGGLSDLLGYFIVDFTGLPPYYLFTLQYFLLGFFAYFIVRLFLLIKKTYVSLIINITLSSLIYIGLLIYLTYSDCLNFASTTYVLENWLKITLAIVAFLLFALLYVLAYFINRYFKKKNNHLPLFPFLNAITVLEICFALFLGSGLKTYYFEVPFLLIFMAQAIVFFIDVPLYLFILLLLLRLVKSYYKIKEI